MKRCKVCGTNYKENAEFCLKCNLPLAASTNKPASKPVTPKHEEFDPQKLETKLQQDFIQDLSKKVVKVSLQHPFSDNNEIKKNFESQSQNDFQDAMGYSSTDMKITLDENVLNFQLFILSNSRIIESTRNKALQGSLFYIIVHFFEQSQLELVRKQLIGIDTFIEEYSRNSSLIYPLAIIGLNITSSDEHQLDLETKENFLFDLQSIISKINGLQERFIIKFFDFSNNKTINFKELGKFYFERFIKDQKVPTFENN